MKHASKVGTIRFEDFVRCLREKYREDFLDSIADILMETVEAQISSIVMALEDRCLADKLGMSVEELTEDHIYIHGKLVRDCHREIEMRVYKQ